MRMHAVVSGDQLSKLALHYYGSLRLWPHIFNANRDQLDDPDDIFVGQVLRIPPAPSAEPPAA